MNINHLSSVKFNVLTAAARRPSAELMAESLRAKGVSIDAAEVASLSTDTARLNALHQLDFAGDKTAFEHIESVAAAKTLADGSPSAALAAELFSLAGTSRTATFGKCYARTNHTIYALHHTGEMNRILADLAVKGAVTLADGTVAKWNPKTFVLTQENPFGPGIQTPADRLWGGLHALLTQKELPANGEIFSSTADAFRGQMANIATRLMGEQFVNVKGAEALPHLNGIVDSFGPMLAEFGNHGGSVAQIAEAGTVRSLENGYPTPRDMDDGRLGYVVVPQSEAAAKGIAAIEYPETDDKGYAKPGPLAPAVTDVKVTK